MPKSSTIFVKTRFNWLSPFTGLLILVVFKVFTNVRIINSHLSLGIFLASRNASILFTIISPSRCFFQ